MKNTMVLFLFFFFNLLLYSLKLKEASLPFQRTMNFRCFQESSHVFTLVKCILYFFKDVPKTGWSGTSAF